MHTTATKAKSPALWKGVLFWSLFSCIVIIFRGVRWDENYEFAQVILGQVPYPDAHPLAQYVHSFYSLQTWLLAALMHFVPGPLLANTLRNLLFLLATTLPVFLITSHLSQNRCSGHIATALVLLGVHIPFYSNYPVQVWPDLYSNGHIGLGYTLLVLYLILAQKRRSACFCFGLAPAIHLGQFPPLFLLGMGYLLFTLRHHLFKDLRKSLPWLLSGLGISLLFGFFIHRQTLPLPATGPYYDLIAPKAVFKGYMAHFAGHRSIPHGSGHIALAATPLLALLGARREWLRTAQPGPWCLLLLYTLAVCALVWGTMGVHMVLGSDIPFFLIGWMPYRLINHQSPLLLAMAIATLHSTTKNNRSSYLLPSLLFIGSILFLVKPFTENAFYLRYLSSGEWIYFFLIGGAIAVQLHGLKNDRAFLSVWTVLATFAFLLLLYHHQYGAGCMVFGIVITTLLENPKLPKARPILLYSALACCLLTLLFTQALQRTHLAQTPFENAVGDYLAREDSEESILLVPYQQEGLQARLHHAVMTDMATMTWIPYRPELGPSLYKMYRDCYGLNFAPDEGKNAIERPWFKVWSQRTQQQWQELSAEYNVRYLLTPTFLELDLPLLIDTKMLPSTQLYEQTGRFYKIPKKTNE